MEIIIAPNYEEMSRLAARLVRRQILQKPNSVLGLATGSTPIGLYDELVRMHRDEGLDFSKTTTFNLDEYLGLSPKQPAELPLLHGSAPVQPHQRAAGKDPCPLRSRRENRRILQLV